VERPASTGFLRPVSRLLIVSFAMLIGGVVALAAQAPVIIAAIFFILVVACLVAATIFAMKAASGLRAESGQLQADEAERLRQAVSDLTNGRGQPGTDRGQER